MAAVLSGIADLRLPRVGWRNLPVFAVALSAAVAAATPSAAALPAVKVISAPIVSPSTAWTAYGSNSAHSTGVAATTSTPPELASLARSLGANNSAVSQAQYTQNVFDYVRNNIGIEFRFGLSKGGRGALIDQSGTAFDQAELMVKLLRLDGLSPTYQVGTITLTPQQFGTWSGFVTGLNQTNQTFAVNAQAACQFLADGGIPAVVTDSANDSSSGQTGCAALTGNLGGVTLAHIWVQVNGLVYDPAFKQFKLKAGVDVASAAGCGTESAPTCGSNATTVATGPTSGATQSTLAGAPTIQGANATALESQLSTSAVSVETYIKSNLPTAQLNDVIGGGEIDPTYNPPPAAALPYPSSSPQYTWSGDIPDQFRTTFNAQYQGIAQSFFADEASGRQIEFSSTQGTSNDSGCALLIDGQIITNVTGSSFAARCSGGTFVATILHPYAALGGQYGADTVSLPLPSAAPPTPTLTSFTIVAKWGATGDFAPKYAEAMEGVAYPFGLTPSYEGAAAGETVSCNSAMGCLCNMNFGCLRPEEPTLSEEIAQQRTRFGQIVGRISNTQVTNQHTIGFITTGFASTGAVSGPVVSLQSELSVDSTTGSTSDAGAAFQTFAAGSSLLEGSVPLQGSDGAAPLSAVSLFSLMNSVGDTFVNVSPGQMSNVLPSLVNYTAARQANLISASAAGYSFILPRNGEDNSTVNQQTGLTIEEMTGGIAPDVYGGPDLAFMPGATAYLIEESYKGGAAPTSLDPTQVVLETTKQTDYTLTGKKYSSIDLTTGDLTLKPAPDIVTGVGDFPYSLPFQRFYRSSRAYETSMTIESWSGTGASIATTPLYSAADIWSYARLGSGWTHNYAIEASIGNNGVQAMGGSSGVDASAAIAGTYTLFDAERTQTFASQLTGILIANWIGKQFIGNTVTVDLPPRSVTFARLPDLTWHAPPGSADALTVTGTRQGPIWPSGGVAGGSWDYTGVSVTYTTRDGSVLTFGPSEIFSAGTGTAQPRQFSARKWSYPDGMAVTFNYSTYAPQSPPAPTVYVLTSVTNTFGRSLTFAASPITTSGQAASVAEFISSVSDENGRKVTYTRPAGCGHGVDTSRVGWLCNTFTVTLPDSTTQEKYDGTPDPADGAGSLGLRGYGMRHVYAPSNLSSPYQTFIFDSFLRAALSTDALLRQTQYFPAGFFNEPYAHGEVIDPLGNVTNKWFDKWNDELMSVDPLGRATARAYDGAHRATLVANPALDCVAVTYDVRSNPLVTASYPAGSCGRVGAVLTPPSLGWPVSTCPTYPTSASIRVTCEAFGEAANVVSCANIVTCNEPTIETDALGNATTYNWNASTGQLSQVLKPTVWSPSDGANEQPKTVLFYSAFNGVSLLSSKQDYISASVSTTTAFGYNASNKYVLQTATVDSGGLNLTTTFAFDGNQPGPGNLTSVRSPRTDVLSASNFTWDVDRRSVLAIQPAPASGVMVATKNYYDADGELIEVDKGTTTSTTGADFAPLETTTFAYDLVGNKIQTLVLNGTSLSTTPLALTQVGYDADDRPICTVVRMNPSAFASLEATAVSGSTAASALPTSACTLGAAGALGNDRITQTNYDTAGEVLNMVKALGDVAQESYESFCQIAQNPNPATQCYTANGKQQYVLDSVGNLTKYYYDGFDRLVQTNFPVTALAAGQYDSTSAPPATCTAPPPGADVERYCYDQNGNRTDLFKRDQTHLSFAYDPLNRESAKTVPQLGTNANIVSPAYTVVTQYDLLNRKLSATFGNPPAPGVVYTYDNAGRVLTETTSPTLSTGRTLAYSYLDGVNRTQVTWPDGFYASYIYDAPGRPTAICQNFIWSSCTPTASADIVGFSYDSLGRRSQLSRPNGLATTYAYDNADRVICIAQNCSANPPTGLAFSYAYSPAGQDLSKGTSSDVTTWSAYTAGTVSKAFDGLNRDLTDVTLAQNGACGTPGSSGGPFGYDCNGSLTKSGVGSFTYDQENRLLSATLASSSAVIAYDPLGRIETYQATNGGATATDTFLYDGDRLAAEYSSTGAMLKRYIHGVGTDEPLAWLDNNGGAGPWTTNWLHADRQGSIVASSVSGGTLAQYPYGPYGEPQSWGLSRFAYTGQIMLPEAQLYHYKARAYDPISGRFMQTDPVGYKDDVDLYGFVGEDPTDRSDPTGLQGDVVANGIGVTQILRDMCNGEIHCMARQAVMQGTGVLAAGAVIVCVAGGCELVGATATGLAARCPSCLIALLNFLRIANAAASGDAAQPDLVLALGKDELLAGFAGARGAETFRTLGWGADWTSKFMEAMSSAKTAVAVDLSGLGGETATSAAARSADGAGNATAFDWELEQIKEHPEWWPRIEWIKNGKPVDNPFA